MKDEQKTNDKPKATAEGDKLPEDPRRNIEDPMNQKKQENKNNDSPEATAEGDKLPEK